MQRKIKPEINREKKSPLINEIPTKNAKRIKRSRFRIRKLRRSSAEIFKAKTDRVKRAKLFTRKG